MYDKHFFHAKTSNLGKKYFSSHFCRPPVLRTKKSVAEFVLFSF